MRGYFELFPSLIDKIEKQKSFEKVLKLITKFSYENLGNRLKARKKIILRKKKKINMLVVHLFYSILKNKF